MPRKAILLILIMLLPALAAAINTSCSPGPETDPRLYQTPPTPAYEPDPESARSNRDLRDPAKNATAEATETTPNPWQTTDQAGLLPNTLPAREETPWYLSEPTPTPNPTQQGTGTNETGTNEARSEHPAEPEKSRLIVGGQENIPGLPRPRLRMRTGEYHAIQLWIIDQDGIRKLPETAWDHVTVTSAEPGRISVIGNNVLNAPYGNHADVTVSYQGPQQNLTATVRVVASGGPELRTQYLQELETNPRIITAQAKGQQIQVTPQAHYTHLSGFAPLPQDLPYPVVWWSSDPQVATMTQNGLITVHQSGGTNINLGAGVHSNDHPNHLLALFTEGNTRKHQPCPVQDAQGNTYSGVQLEVFVEDNREYQHRLAGTKMAQAIGGTWKEYDWLYSKHTLEYPCPPGADAEKITAMRHISQILMDRPETTYVNHERYDHQEEKYRKQQQQEQMEQLLGQEDQPAEAEEKPKNVTARLPQEAENEFMQMTLLLDRITVRPGQTVNLFRGNQMQFQGENHIRVLDPQMNPPVLAITPVVPEQGYTRTEYYGEAEATSETHPYMSRDGLLATALRVPTGHQHLALTPHGDLTVYKEANFTSFNVTYIYQGLTASQRIDVRGPEAPGCRGGVEMLEIAWKEPDTSFQPAPWRTIEAYPEFNTSVVEAPCRTGVIEEAARMDNVLEVRQYRPTDQAYNTQLQKIHLDPEDWNIVQEIQQERELAVRRGTYPDGGIKLLSEAQKYAIDAASSHPELVIRKTAPASWTIRATQPGRYKVTLSQAATEETIIVVNAVAPEPSDRQQTPNPAEDLNRVVLEQDAEPFEMYLGETHKLRIDAEYMDGSVRRLDPANQPVTLTWFQDRSPTTESDGTMRPSETGQYEITATYREQEATLTVNVLQRNTTPPPAVSQDCTYLPPGETTRARLDHLLLGPDSTPLTWTEDTPAKIVGQIPAENTPYPSLIARFPCQSQDDLQRAWNEIHERSRYTTVEPYPITGTRAQVEEIEIDMYHNISPGMKMELEIEASYLDGATRTLTETEKARVRTRSSRPGAVATDGGLTYRHQGPGTAVITAELDGVQDQHNIEAYNHTIDRQCRIWALTWDLSGSRTIGYTDIREIKLRLNKETPTEYAQEIARMIGESIDTEVTFSETHGPDLPATQTIHGDYDCEADRESAYWNLVTVMEKIVLEQAIIEINFPLGGRSLGVDLGKRLQGPADEIGRQTADRNQQIPASIHVLRATESSIRPLNQVRLFIYGKNTNGDIHYLDEEFRRNINITSSDPQVLRVERRPQPQFRHTYSHELPEQRIYAGSPGTATLTLRNGSHTAQTTIKVSPPLELPGPEAPNSCLRQENGITFDASHLIIRLDAKPNGEYPHQDYADAVAGDMDSHVLKYHPESGTYLVAAACPGSGEDHKTGTRAADLWLQVAAAQPRITGGDDGWPNEDQNAAVQARLEIYNATCDQRLKSFLRWEPEISEQTVQILVQKLKDQRESCAGNWNPQTDDGNAVGPRGCFPNDAARRNPDASVDGVRVPDGLRENENPQGPVRNTTGEDSKGNLIIYWHEDHMPSDGAPCWLLRTP